MFPPKKPAGPPQPGGPPQAQAGPGMPPGPPGMGGPPPMGMPPGMPMPAAGADPMSAMLGQLGPGAMGGMAPPPPSFPAGPGGLPFGGTMPGMGMEGEEGGDGSDSPLLQSLMSGLSGDPYGVAPGEPDHALDGGTGDPGMGMGQLMQLLALAAAGIGGSPQQGVAPGGSGVPQDPTNPGMMMGY